MRKYTRRGAQQWKSLIDEQQQSGLSPPEFCKQHSVGYPSFCAWRKRLSSDAQSLETHAPAFVELTPPDPAPSTQRWSVELDLGSGLCLRIATA